MGELCLEHREGETSPLEAWSYSEDLRGDLRRRDVITDRARYA